MRKYILKTKESVFFILIVGSIIYFSSFAPSIGQKAEAQPGKDSLKRAKAQDSILRYLNSIIPDSVNRAMYIYADSASRVAALRLGLKVHSENLTLLGGTSSMMAGNGPFMSFRKASGETFLTNLEYVIFTKGKNNSKDLLWYSTWGGSWPIIKPEYLNRKFAVSYVLDSVWAAYPSQNRVLGGRIIKMTLIKNDTQIDKTAK